MSPEIPISSRVVVYYLYDAFDRLIAEYEMTAEDDFPKATREYYYLGQLLVGIADLHSIVEDEPCTSSGCNYDDQNQLRHSGPLNIALLLVPLGYCIVVPRWRKSNRQGKMRISLLLAMCGGSLVFLFALTSSPLKAETTYEYQSYIVYTDHLGTPLRLTNDSGALVWAAEYETFGKVASLDEDVDQDGTGVTLNFRFPGQYYDAESGLYYNWNRYYDPEVGRYLQSDNTLLFHHPLLSFLTIDSQYVYSMNNVLSYIDPTGLRTILIVLAGSGSGKSSFGHLAVSVNNIVYSYETPQGTGLWSIIPFWRVSSSMNTYQDIKTYQEREIFNGREMTFYEIDECYFDVNSLIDYFNSYDDYQDKFNAWTNNCSDPFEDWAESQGIDMGVNITPQGTVNAFLRNYGGSTLNVWSDTYYLPGNGNGNDNLRNIPGL